MEVKLIPGQGNPNIKLELERLLMTCKSFKGCVAFWTISPDYFDFNALGEALKKTNSFFVLIFSCQLI